MAVVVIALILMLSWMGISTTAETNIALGKHTNQTSTKDDHFSHRAVDGVLDTNGSAGSAPCARIHNTDPKSPAEWWVDLKDDYIVHTITVYNSIIGGYYIRMANFEIGVIRDNHKEVVCDSHGNTPVPPAGNITFTCPSDAVGRYVHFRRLGGPDIHRVTICEVQVTGTLLSASNQTVTTPSPFDVTTVNRSSVNSTTQAAQTIPRATSVLTESETTTAETTIANVAEHTSEKQPETSEPSTTKTPTTTIRPSTNSTTSEHVQQTKTTSTKTSTETKTSEKTTPAKTTATPKPTPPPTSTSQDHDVTSITTTATTKPTTKRTTLTSEDTPTPTPTTTAGIITQRTEPSTTATATPTAAETKPTGDAGPSSSTGSSLAVNVAVPVVAAIVLVVIIVIGVFFWRKYAKPKQDGDELLADGPIPVPLTVLPIGIEPTPPVAGDRVVASDELESYVQGRLLDNDDLLKEFKVLPEDDPSQCETSLMNIHMPKNRYRNILSYESTRVVLECEEGSDDHYINANYIKGYKDQPKAYIATQGAKSNTLGEFWQMVWQEGATRILMLTNLKENRKDKVYRYWPEEAGVPQTYGDYQVTVEAVEHLMDYNTTMLLVEHDGAERRVRHFHFTTWTDMGRPKNGPSSLINFHKHVRSFDSQSKGPIVVHCSAGVGRTGTFIAFDILQQQLKQDGQVEIYKCVKELREQRMTMVQTKDQYVFLHQTLVEVATVGYTAHSCSGFSDKLREMRRQSGGTSELQKEFKLLCSKKTFPDRAGRSGYEAANIRKNRDSTVVPAEDVRPYLSTPDPDGNHYINAVYVNSYKKPRWYIVTQSPLQHTVTDFWRLVYDQRTSTIVVLSEVDELNDGDDEKDPASSCPQYWPSTEAAPSTYGPIVVELVTTTQPKPDIVCRDFKVHASAREDDTLIVRQIQLQGWPKDCTLPERKDAIMDLLDEVLSWQQTKSSKEGEAGEVVVHCTTGRGPSGIFCGVSYTLDKMKVEQEVDAFQAARHVCQTRPEFFNTLEEYESLYSNAVTYMARYDTYGNFQ